MDAVQIRFVPLQVWNISRVKAVVEVSSNLNAVRLRFHDAIGVALPFDPESVLLDLDSISELPQSHKVGALPVSLVKQFPNKVRCLRSCF